MVSSSPAFDASGEPCNRDWTDIVLVSLVDALAHVEAFWASPLNMLANREQVKVPRNERMMIL